MKNKAQLVFKVGGKIWETLTFDEEDWKPSPFNTYETQYKAGWFTRKDCFGYHYSISLERPCEKVRAQLTEEHE